MMSQRQDVIQTRADGRLLPVLQVGEIPLEVDARRWLIEGLWGACSVGFLAGSPKTCKSWMGLDMAVSVASGTPCLDCYRVEERGKVLIYLAEDSLAAVRERVEGIARHRGLSLDGLDLDVVTSASLRLDRIPDRERLRETVRALKPRFLLLDPLVRMHSIDENCSTAVAALLSYIRDLERNFQLSVVIVHHTRKSGPSGGQTGQALRGSGDLHAFCDSALYLRQVRKELILSVEHRAAAAPDPVCLQLVVADEDAIHLEVRAKANVEKGRRQRDLDRAVLEVLTQHDILTRDELRKALGVKNERLGEVLGRLEEEGLLQREPRGWRLSGRGHLVNRSHSPL